MSIAVRCLTKTGCYPKGNFSNSDASYTYDENTELLLSCVTIQPCDESYFQSGTAWALLSEIRLWSSIALTLFPANGTYSFIPAERPMVFKDLSSSDPSTFIKRVPEKLLKSELRECFITGYKFTEEGYTFHNTTILSTEVSDFYSAIDTNDHVLMRGLSCLLKTKVLSQSYLAMEEAALLTYVSAEAVFNLLLKKLNFKTVKELYAYIEETVPNGQFLVEYHKECRANRNILVHPKSPMTTLGLPYLEADDYFDTYTSLIELYRFYLLNNPILNNY